MVDQVTVLRSAGVGAAILRGAGIPSGGRVTDKLLVDERDIERGKFSLLFDTPEAIVESERWRELLLGEPPHRQIVAVAVDEAHCVYKWYNIIDTSILSCVLHISLYMHTHAGVQSLGHHLLVFMNYVVWFLLEFHTDGYCDICNMC